MSGDDAAARRLGTVGPANSHATHCAQRCALLSLLSGPQRLFTESG